MDKRAVIHALNGWADKVEFKTNGTIEARNYSSGSSACAVLAASIRELIPNAVIVESMTRRAAFPRVSYAKVVFRIQKTEAA